MPRSATLSVDLAKQIKDLMPTMSVLGVEMDQFFSTLVGALDDAITETERTNKATIFSVKVTP